MRNLKGATSTVDSLIWVAAFAFHVVHVALWVIKSVVHKNYCLVNFKSIFMVIQFTSDVCRVHSPSIYCTIILFFIMLSWTFCFFLANGRLTFDSALSIPMFQSSLQRLHSLSFTPLSVCWEYRGYRV
jgi:hypothetical protein